MELLLEGGRGGAFCWATLARPGCRLESAPCVDPVAEAAAEGTSLWLEAVGTLRLGRYGGAMNKLEWVV